MQPTARSTSQRSSSTGTAPTEWHRSQSISAPAWCTIWVMTAMSASAPLRYATWDRLTSAVSSSTAARTAPGSRPWSMSVFSMRSLAPRWAAIPSST